VGELVDEIEDQGGDAVLGEMARQTLEQAFAIGRGEDLLVAHRHVAAAHLAQLLDQQLGLMRV